MTSQNAHIACDDFTAKLAEHLDGDLPEVSRTAMQVHASSCADCGRLLSELDALRMEAAVLPPLEPSRDLWAGIAERIDARVLPMEATRIGRGVAVRRTWRHPAVAAAALVLFTAGVTHMLTRASLNSPAAPTASMPGAAPSEAPTIDASSAVGAPTTIAAQTSQPEGRAGQPASGTPRGQSIASRASRGSDDRAPGVPTVTPPLVRQVAGPSNARGIMRTEVEPVYDREIVKLRAIVRNRRAQLDPQTVAVLEQSIAVIDSAIAQSRAALARDPASGFLATQLNHSLEKKVELLRTAALLPARI